ncbi:hypothetical protein [Nocardia sp. NPDC049707]|uniref:hypothetical protein n=1 Tax=Nocardia sp. NPDC049707 TaxID=3154735 RepID=UPI00343FE55A
MACAVLAVRDLLKLIARAEVIGLAVGDRVRCAETTGGYSPGSFSPAAPTLKLLLPDALEVGSAYVPGSVFAVDGGYRHSMRLCFTTSDVANAAAVDRLVRAARQQ